MIARALIWYAVALPSSVYALRRGGQPEKLVAAMVVLGSTATMLVPSVPGLTYQTVVWPLLWIDLVLLGGIVAVALIADRFWPMYFAAIHLLAVALHGVRAYDSTILPSVYARMGGQLGYLTLLFLALGTWRHVRRNGVADWAWQVPRPATAGQRTIDLRPLS